jgi:hypothetical protein
MKLHLVCNAEDILLRTNKLKGKGFVAFNSLTSWYLTVEVMTF